MILCCFPPFFCFVFVEQKVFAVLTLVCRSSACSFLLVNMNCSLSIISQEPGFLWICTQSMMLPPSFFPPYTVSSCCFTSKMQMCISWWCRWYFSCLLLGVTSWRLMVQENFSTCCIILWHIFCTSRSDFCQDIAQMIWYTCVDLKMFTG